MKLWPFKRKGPEPPPEPEGVSFPATPYAGLLVDLIELGLTAPQLVYVVHRIEVERAKAKAELNLSAANVAMVQQPRVTKPKVVTRSRVRRARVPKKRNRANYMRDYRSRLKLVTDNTPRGGDAA